MKRADLLSVLKYVKEALSSQDIIPIYSHFCFEGESVTAYDDIVAIEFPLVTDIECCLPGMPLFRYLSAMSGTEVTVSDMKGDVIQIKGGKSKVKFNYLPLENFVFNFPAESKRDIIIKLDDDFFTGLGLCSKFISSDPSYIYTTGVALCQNPDEGLLLFSTDLKTLTRYDLSAYPKKGAWHGAKILPSKFCKIITSISKDFKYKEMRISDGHAVVTFDGGITIFTKLIDPSEVPDFSSVFKDRCGDVSDCLSVVPESMVSMLERADTVFSADIVEKNLHLKVGDNGIDFIASSTYGDFREHIKIMDMYMPNEDLDECVLSLQLLNRILPSSKRFVLLEENIVFVSGEENEFIHLISYVEEED